MGQVGHLSWLKGGSSEEVRSSEERPRGLRVLRVCVQASLHCCHDRETFFSWTEVILSVCWVLKVWAWVGAGRWSDPRSGPKAPSS